MDVNMGAVPSESDNKFQDSEFDGSFTTPAEFIFSSTEIEMQATQTSRPLEIFPQFTQDSQADAFLTEDFSWAMIELGVHEPLPPQDTIDELYVSLSPFFHLSQTASEHKPTSQKSIHRSP